MKGANHYKKYQVYFFLYLAVICELLIIIVERDDAEAELLAQQRNLEEKNRRIILELLKNMPAVSAAGDNQLKVGETRAFTVSVKGLGVSDEVTTPPSVKVMREGEMVETLSYPDAIKDSMLHASTGERMYRFEWSAKNGPGKYELWVDAGTNRVSLTPDIDEGTAKVKVGSLEFTRRDIRTALDSDPELAGVPIEEFVRQSETLESSRFFVEVVSEEYDQLQIQADPIVTAAGFPAFNEIKVRGTTVDKVAGMNADGGGAVLSPSHESNPWHSDNPEHGKWTWTNTFNKPGTYTVTVDARDKRQAGVKSVAKAVKFEVTVKRPYLSRSVSSGAYAGEVLEQYVNVAGLEDVGGYRWTVLLDGSKVAEGRGAVARYSVPNNAAGKALVLKSEYRGRSYMLLADSSAVEARTSEFLWNVVSPRDRIASMSFAKGGEYPINNVFQFVAARCGKCSPANVRNVDAGDIRVQAESEDGRDLLDDYMLTPRRDSEGRDAGTLVKFYLKATGRVPKDGLDATITIRIGAATEVVPVRLYPE